MECWILIYCVNCSLGSSYLLHCYWTVTNQVFEKDLSTVFETIIFHSLPSVQSRLLHNMNNIWDIHRGLLIDKEPSCSNNPYIFHFLPDFIMRQMGNLFPPRLPASWYGGMKTTAGVSCRDSEIAGSLLGAREPHFHYPESGPRVGLLAFAPDRAFRCGRRDRVRLQLLLLSGPRPGLSPDYLPLLSFTPTFPCPFYTPEYIPIDQWPIHHYRLLPVVPLVQKPSTNRLWCRIWPWAFPDVRARSYPYLCKYMHLNSLSPKLLFQVVSCVKLNLGKAL